MFPAEFTSGINKCMFLESENDLYSGKKCFDFGYLFEENGQNCLHYAYDKSKHERLLELS